MPTYHIHITGLVQGVGFRPFVCRLAGELGISGWVSNTSNGVHIECTSTDLETKDFYNKILSSPPANAIISSHHIEIIEDKIFDSFSIRSSTRNELPDLLLTPDISICDSCAQEIRSEKNPRYGYAFTTCLNCGPRYSIITELPYDRENTTMHNHQMCDDCLAEYKDITNHRHFSQTNSCGTCGIPMHLYQSKENQVSDKEAEILAIIQEELSSGKIIAVKGIGGYLLLADAGDEKTIQLLRERKHRPGKPFAVLYANISMAMADIDLRDMDIAALQDKSGPIVLCTAKTGPSKLKKEFIAPRLDKIGILLPCSPLLLLIAEKFGGPLIATSANISHSPIIYRDEDALENLFDVADFVLTFDRDIVSAQDDSVIQFSKKGQKIILRRGRGLAPNYFPNPFRTEENNLLAMGSDLKNTFSILDRHNLYVSQYLGDQSSLESQNCFKVALKHVSGLVNASPDQILTDKHPGYFSSDYGKQIARNTNKPFTAVQHHKAHFGAVLAENNLLHGKDSVLGFIWDGTGYGDDGQVWGGEVFLYQDEDMKRLAHMDYFPQLSGDKMAREPRLSALSLLSRTPGRNHLIRSWFSKAEWHYFQQLQQQPGTMLTSSMGRFLDGMAALLGICGLNTYEGQAAMELESRARNCSCPSYDYFDIPLKNNILDWRIMLVALLDEIESKKDISAMAYKIFFSLAKMINRVSRHFNVPRLAFSGGVFQNALLTDLLFENLGNKKLHFHQQLSPNDESISFGQIACFEMASVKQKDSVAAKNNEMKKELIHHE